MRNGTRRMWARRMLRAGWLIAPAFALPGKAYRTFLCDEQGKFSLGAVCITAFILGVVLGVSSCTRTVVRANTIATPDQVAEFLKGDQCMIEMMPRWLKNQDHALTVQNLHEGKASCRNTFETHYAKIEQKKAMTMIGSK